jgi:hypothetical protein
MIAAQLRQLVEPHAQALEACADGMAASGIGLAHDGGHVTYLRKMAWDLRKAAEAGVVPDVYMTMNGAKETEMQNVLDGTPAAIKAAMATPECKEVSHILKKYSISIEGVESVGAFDLRIRAKAVPLSSRLQLKSALVRAGILV